MRPSSILKRIQHRNAGTRTLMPSFGHAVMMGCVLTLLPWGVKKTSAQLAQKPAGYTLNLLEEGNLLEDGALSHWKVTDCEVTLQDGRLRFVEGDGFIRSQQPYQDFVLSLEWRAIKASNWDSGIYVRAEPPPEGKPWPDRYQINLKQGSEGELIGEPPSQCSRLVKPGEWNRFEVTAVGKKLTLTINDQVAWTIDTIENACGYIGLQSEVPLGGIFEFRNVTITELNFQSLFNGKDLAGWETVQSATEPCWIVKDETLICTGKAGSWLRSAQTWNDFNLRLEYRLRPAGNSGVYLRVPEDGNHHGDDSGIEVQILDDQHEKYANLKPYQYSGSLYGLEPASSHPGRAPGRWNQLEIDCRGDRYRVRLNGVTVIQTDASATAALAKRRQSGFIGLQNHQEEVEFRRLRIGPAMPIPASNERE